MGNYRHAYDFLNAHKNLHGCANARDDEHEDNATSRQRATTRNWIGCQHNNMFDSSLSSQSSRLIVHLRIVGDVSDALAHMEAAMATTTTYTATTTDNNC